MLSSSGKTKCLLLTQLYTNKNSCASLKLPARKLTAQYRHYINYTIARKSQINLLTKHFDSRDLSSQNESLNSHPKNLKSFSLYCFQTSHLSTHSKRSCLFSFATHWSYGILFYRYKKTLLLLKIPIEIWFNTLP